MKYDLALPIAEKLTSLLAPGCMRIEIAGSIRRMASEPGDIEIVALPDQSPYHLVFGRPAVHNLLDAILYELEIGDDETIHLHEIKGGQKFRQFWVSTDGGRTWVIKLDLFLVTPPADWGVIYLIRTGPADFSHWIVTPKYFGGGLPNGLQIQGGRVLTSDGEHIHCWDEIDFLHVCNLDWIEPKDRHLIHHRAAQRIQLPQSG